MLEARSSFQVDDAKFWDWKAGAASLLDMAVLFSFSASWHAVCKTNLWPHLHVAHVYAVASLQLFI